MACALALAAGCVTGVGEGDIRGVVSAPSCGIDASEPFNLAPDYFVAEEFEPSLNIRIQHGGDEFDYANVLYVTVLDSEDVARNQLGVDLAVGDQLDSPVRMSLALNESCDFHDRTSIPVNYQAVSGTIRFTSIYASGVSDTKSTEAEFVDVHFIDPASPTTRYATLSGWFRFLYSRGRPAQVFP